MLGTLTQRGHPVWTIIAGVLVVTVVVGIATEAGPTAFVAACLVAVTLYTRSRHRDATRLMASAAVLALLGVAAAAIPTGIECGVPLVESVRHMSEPTPHVHGPCEQANDRRAIAADVLLLGAPATAIVGRRRRVT